MNIIKQIKDASGNNIYPIAYAQGGMKMDLLWTNPSTTSSFSAQTVSLDLSDYDIYAIDYIYSNADKYSFGLRFFKTDNSQNILPINGNGSTTCGRRYVQYGASGLQFFDASYNSNTNNTYVVPTHIYGIKMSYIVPTSVHGLQYIEV